MIDAPDPPPPQRRLGKETFMAVYRIYFQHQDGRLEAGDAFECKTDIEAIGRLPRPVRRDVRVELWQGGRWIGMAGLCGSAPRPALAEA